MASNQGSIPQMLDTLQTNLNALRTVFGYGAGSGAMPAQIITASPIRAPRKMVHHAKSKTAIAAVPTAGTAVAAVPAKRVLSRAAKKKLSVAATERWAKKKAGQTQVPQAA
jgi:hypothetical protein